MKKGYSYILKNFILPVADHVMHTDIIYYLNLLKHMENWSQDQIEYWQNLHLKKIVNYAYLNTKYYKELFDENGINCDDIKDKRDLTKIPVLTRKLVVSNYDNLISLDIKNISHKKASTGGTTNLPMKFLLDNKSWSFANANYIFNWEKTNYNYGDKYVALGSTSISVNKSKSFKHKIFYSLKNKIGLNGMKMTDSICQNYVERIKKEQIKYLYGYASSIYLLAKYVLKSKINLDIFTCFTTSEVLTELYRDEILKVFQCNIVNCYGAHDSGITAFDHLGGDFRVSYNTIVTDFKSGNTKENLTPIITTNLLNYAMPMINYELGDIVKLKEKSPNYNGQVIEKVYGRTTDIIQFDDGTVITTIGFYSNLFKKLPVKSYKLVKTGKYELTCEIIVIDGFNDNHAAEIKKVLHRYVGKQILIRLKFVSSFSHPESGKKNYNVLS